MNTIRALLNLLDDLVDYGSALFWPLMGLLVSALSVAGFLLAVLVYVAIVAGVSQ